MQPMSRELVDPAAVGVDPERLDLLLRRARLEVTSGRLPSCQIALAKDGRLVAFETIGEATPSSRYILQSASRPILASPCPPLYVLQHSGKCQIQNVNSIFLVGRYQN